VTVKRSPRPRDADYLTSVRQLGCCVASSDCIGDAQSHHAGVRPGIALKADDYTAIAFCVYHHDVWHAASGPFKTMDKAARRAWCDDRIAETQRRVFGEARMPATGTGAVQGPDHYSWKGDSAAPMTKRARAQRRYVLGQCVRCLKPATERHHIDEDTGNNIPANIELLCRRCHMKVDGRLDKLVERLPSIWETNRRPDRACRLCGRVSPPKRMWKDRCHRCHEYFRRNGVERPTVRARPEPKECLICGQLSAKQKRSRCTRCYRYLSNNGVDRPVDLGHGLRGKRRGHGRSAPVGLPPRGR